MGTYVQRRAWGQADAGPVTRLPGKDRSENHLLLAASVLCTGLGAGGLAGCGAKDLGPLATTLFGAGLLALGIGFAVLWWRFFFRPVWEYVEVDARHQLVRLVLLGRVAHEVPSAQLGEPWIQQVEQPDDDSNHRYFYVRCGDLPRPLFEASGLGSARRMARALARALDFACAVPHEVKPTNRDDLVRQELAQVAELAQREAGDALVRLIDPRWMEEVNEAVVRALASVGSSASLEYLDDIGRAFPLLDRLSDLARAVRETRERLAARPRELDKSPDQWAPPANGAPPTGDSRSGGVPPSVPTSTSTPRKPPKIFGKLYAVVMGALLLFGLVRFCMSHPRGWATGAIRSQGAPHGNFVVSPVTCVTGGHWGFDGVWVVPETLEEGNRRGFRGGLKIVRANSVWEAQVEQPTGCVGFRCPQWRVEPEHCRRFDVVVEPMRWWLRRDGHAHLDCVFPEGGTLTTDLTFHGCGSVPDAGDEP